MELDTAKNIVEESNNFFMKWGNLAEAMDGPYSYMELLEALSLIVADISSKEVELREELTKANRRLGAANAREARMKKKIKKLEAAS